MTAQETLVSYVDAFNRADVDELVAHYADVTDYRQPFTPPLTDRRAIRDFEAGMFSAFSDVSVEVEWMVENGAEASAGLVIRAVHTADMATPAGVLPATGTAVVIHNAEFMRVDDGGRIVHHRRYADTGELMAQLQGQQAG